MIVLLHGFTGSPDSWSAVRSRLRAPSVAPRLVGHGAPAIDVEKFDDEVARLAALIDERYGRLGVLAGYSMGGRLALGVVARYPALVASAVVIGAHPGLTTESARRARRDDDEALAREILEDGVAAFVERWQRAPIFASQSALAEATLEAQRAIRLGHDAAGLARALRTVGLGQMPDLRAALRESTVPLTVVTGALDEKYTALAGELVAGSRSATQTVAPGVGHNVLLEAPSLVADAIERASDAAAARPRGPTRSATEERRP